MASNLDLLVPAKLDGRRTGGPWVIRNPYEKLEAKYFACGRDVCWKSLDYDLYGAQRARGVGWSDRLEGADLYATLLMNSGLRELNARALMERAERIEDALIPLVDEDLASADLARLEQRLAVLFRALRVDGVSLARATKLVWLKRPRLIPMLDREVVTALSGRQSDASREEELFAKQAHLAIARFQSLMLVKQPYEGVDFDNLPRLQALSDDITKAIRAHLVERGVAAPHPVVTPVRALESLLWFDWHGYQYFGYEWNEQEATVRACG